MIKVMHRSGQHINIQGWPSYCIKNNKIYIYAIDNNDTFYIFIRGIAHESEQTQFTFPLLALLPTYEAERAEQPTTRDLNHEQQISA